MALDYLATVKKRCNSDEYGSWISGITEPIYVVYLIRLRERTGFALRGSCDEERVRMAALRHRDQPTRRGGAALRLGFPVANGALHHGLYVLV